MYRLSGFNWGNLVSQKRNTCWGTSRSVATSLIVRNAEGDFLARDRDIESVEAGELLAIRTAGAYGFVQASNYNSRPRSAEVMVENSSWRTVRTRETYEDLIRGERIERART